jgi:hypothetical protein
MDGFVNLAAFASFASWRLAFAAAFVPRAIE